MQRFGRIAEELRKTNKKDLASTYVLRLHITLYPYFGRGLRQRAEVEKEIKVDYQTEVYRQILLDLYNENRFIRKMCPISRDTQRNSCLSKCQR